MYYTFRVKYLAFSRRKMTSRLGRLVLSHGLQTTVSGRTRYRKLGKVAEYSFVSVWSAASLMSYSGSHVDGNYQQNVPPATETQLGNHVLGTPEPRWTGEAFFYSSGEVRETENIQEASWHLGGNRPLFFIKSRSCHNIGFLFTRWAASIHQLYAKHLNIVLINESCSAHGREKVTPAL